MPISLQERRLQSIKSSSSSLSLSPSLIDPYRSSHGKDCGRDQGYIFPVKQVCGLEEVHVGHAVFHARLLESVEWRRQVSKMCDDEVEEELGSCETS